MPYTTLQDREKFNPTFQEFLLKMENCRDISKGDLTYLLYVLAKRYIQLKGKSYTHISSAISSLIDAAEELRRRELNPYEDEKIKENGDIK
jgi:hypothetical protein